MCTSVSQVHLNATTQDLEQIQYHHPSLHLCLLFFIISNVRGIKG